MSLRLSTVTQLLTGNLGMVGSLGTLYHSINIFNDQYLEPDISKESVLKPTVVNVPLLSLNDVPSRIIYCKCGKHPDYVSDRQGTLCPSCDTGSVSSLLSLSYVPPRQKCPRSWRFIDPGYVKGGGTYMVMDNLEVKPMSISSLIRSFGEDFNSLVEKHVQLGCKEGLAILKASLENQAVLTTVFLGKEEKK